MNQPDRKRDSRRSRRQAETRKRLLDAARQVFALTGLTSATIAQITETADLGFGTFYLHFSSKEELYLAVVKEGFTELDRELERVLDEAKKQQYSGKQIIETAIAKFFYFARDNSDLFQVGFAGFDAGMRVGFSLREQYADWFTAVIKDTYPSNISDSELELLSTAMVTMINRSAVWWMQQQEESKGNFLDLETASKIVSRLAIAGLADFYSIDD